MGSDDLDSRIGARIRAMRDARGMTLDGLAGAAEVSRAMLSRIERGESSPTAQLLNRICGGLGVTLSTFFAEAEAPVGPVHRRARQRVWRDPESGYVRRNVSPPDTGSAAEISEIAFPPGGAVSFDNRRVAGRDQHVWVLDGVLEVTLGDEALRLEAGDCLFMRFDRPVRFVNPGPGENRYAVVITRNGGGR